MLLSAVSVLVVAQSSSEIPEGLTNNSVHHTQLLVFKSCVLVSDDRPQGLKQVAFFDDIIKILIWLAVMCTAILKWKFVIYRDILAFVSYSLYHLCVSYYNNTLHVTLTNCIIFTDTIIKCSYCKKQTDIPDAQLRWFFVKMGTHLWRCSDTGRHSLSLWPKKRQHWKPVLQFRTQIFQLRFSGRMREKRNIYNFLCVGKCLGNHPLGRPRERDKRLTLRWMFRRYVQRCKMDGTGSGSPPQWRTWY